MPIEKAEYLNILKQYWGYDQFRHQQWEVIEHIDEYQDGLVLFPTGGGKSLCYQIPGLVKPGICLVISPLISLMKDQVDELVQRNIPARFINSTLSVQEKTEIWLKAQKGTIKFIFTSPEALQLPSIQEEFRSLNLNLIAVDEAHCVSEWGHDFRPAYLKISEALDKINTKAPRLALTATATPKVMEEISEKIGLRNTRIFQSSFKRENLAYFVLTNENMYEQIKRIIRKNKGSGVIYCNSRRKCEETVKWLKEHQWVGAAYHAGLPALKRMEIQEQWKAGEIPIVVATNAFGMGVNKENVRWVIHTDSPINCEAFFQEAGRGGRDGKKAFSILFIPANRKKWFESIENSQLSPKRLKEITQNIYQYFRLSIGEGQDRSFPINFADFTKKRKIGVYELKQSLMILQNQEILRFHSQQSQTVSFRFINIHFSPEEFDDQQLSLLKLYQFLLRKYAHQHFERIQLPLDFLSDFLRVIPQKTLYFLKQLEHLGLIKIYDNFDGFIQFLYPRQEHFRGILETNKMIMLNKHKIDQAEKMRLFSETDGCRMAWMMDYFGENALGYECQVCDNCIKKKPFDYKAFAKLVLKKITQPIAFEDLKKEFPIHQQKAVHKTIAKLIEEEQIEVLDDFLIPIKK
ncbi:MAG: RecQ family ATP-dependent DNA helicase [Flavobacteriales bacterium]|jgi:ATP-dependent DNA helicase RecQ|nr:RecQ family ATP-dependent DNA helicase [Flavobacteriales bacterium]